MDEMVMIKLKSYEKMVYELKYISEERCINLTDTVELCKLRQFKSDVIAARKNSYDCDHQILDFHSFGYDVNKIYNVSREAYKEGE